MHPFDKAMILQPQPDGSFAGHTASDYQNMVGPYGGVTAAVMLRAVLNHPEVLGQPVSATVNFAGPVEAGPFRIRATPLRTNRSTQHWMVVQEQTDATGQTRISTTATVVTGLRRPQAWCGSDLPAPVFPPPDPEGEKLQISRALSGSVWFDRYSFTSVSGDCPTEWDGQESPDGITRLWVRDNPPRALDYCSLQCMCDVFFPRVLMRRRKFVPVGTVSMTTYFHADEALLAETADSHIQAQATGHEYRDGFSDHSAVFWNAQGHVLATTNQVVYYKE